MIGNVNDWKCKLTEIKDIDRKICRNNCKYWDYVNHKCKLNYNNNKIGHKKW
jgi:hypothetical protein